MNNFKQGDRVRVTQNTCGHRIPIGTVILLGAMVGSGYFQVSEHGCNVIPADIEHVLQTKEDIEKDLAEVEAQAEMLRLRLKYMKKTKSDTFDEMEFKVFTALQALKTKKSDVEKARLIAEIIKNE